MRGGDAHGIRKADRVGRQPDLPDGATWLSDSYAKEVMTEGRCGRGHESLEDACAARCGELGTPRTVRKVRSVFGLLKHFDACGDCPSPGEGHALSEHGARLGLAPCFREVVDAFSTDATNRGLRESTVSGCV